VWLTQGSRCLLVPCASLLADSHEGRDWDNAECCEDRDEGLGISIGVSMVSKQGSQTKQVAFPQTP
jgi:hypothetical protein